MKRKNNNDPFANLVLDEEEKFLEEALGRGVFKEDTDFENTKEMLTEAASQYLELHSSN